MLPLAVVLVAFLEDDLAAQRGCLVGDAPASDAVVNGARAEVAVGQLGGVDAVLPAVGGAREQHALHRPDEPGLVLQGGGEGLERSAHATSSGTQTI